MFNIEIQKNKFSFTLGTFLLKHSRLIERTGLFASLTGFHQIYPILPPKKVLLSKKNISSKVFQLPPT